jgi:hypothetical protein
MLIYKEEDKMNNTLNILRDKKITGSYRTKIRLAVNCQFFEAFFTMNPAFRQTANGFELWLKDGTREIVSSDFEVTVYETMEGWNPLCYE